MKCAYVSDNFLETFRMRVTLGRDFTPEDDVRGASPVAIISHELWLHRFGGDPHAVGRTLNIGGSPVPAIVLMVMTATIAWLHRGRFSALRPARSA